MNIWKIQWVKFMHAIVAFLWDWKIIEWGFKVFIKIFFQ